MNVLVKIFGYSKNLWPYHIGILVSTIISTVAGLILPFILKSATDLIVESVQTNSIDSGKVIYLAILLFFFDILRIVVSNIGGYFGDVMGEKLRMQLSVSYYEQLLKLPQSYFDEEHTGKIINRLNRAITEVVRFITAFTNNFFQMFLTSVFTVVIVAFYSWQIALLVLSIYPIFGYLTMRSSKKWQGIQHDKNSQIDQASGRFAEVISQIRVVKSYVTEGSELRSFNGHFKETIGLTKEQSRYWHIMDIRRGGVLSFTFFGIYALIFVETMQGRFSIGDMVLLITLINTVRVPIFSMSFIIDQYQRAVTGAKEYIDVMNISPGHMINDNSQKNLTITKGLVEFKDVSFAYRDGKTILKKISFQILPGEKAALVGLSGGGKTTISNLLMRLYEIKSGSIKIDGQSITDFTYASLRSQIATVFQDPALFSGTVRENIAYGNPSATSEEIIAAAKAANVDDFIDSLEEGYDSLIGERGIKLSGGQKQRVAIARAFLKDSPILILDEATSSLDSRSEFFVQRALERLMKGRTTLIIAHRLSTIAEVDKIITLKGGRIDEIGSPTKLAKSGGIYNELLDIQRGDSLKLEGQLKRFDLSA